MIDPVLTPDAPAPQAEATAAQLREADPLDNESMGTGLHPITKNTNYWFNREFYQIESAALMSAAAWAEKGLPRHDIVRTTPLDPEQVLVKQCSQLFRDWVERVRTKMQDAIEDASQKVGEHVADVRAAVTRLEAIRADVGQVEQKLGDLRRDSERDVRPIRYEKIWRSRVGFWLFAVVLTLVEFFANFPVFKLLLPMNEQLRALARSVLASAQDHRVLAGPLLTGLDVLFHVEATVVALVAVLVIVVLSKMVGAAARPLFALKSSEHPYGAYAIRSHRRQQGTLLLLSAAGVACVLLFLFSARGQIADTASGRVHDEEARIERLQDGLRKAEQTGDMEGISDLTQQIDAAGETLRELQGDAAYAGTVQRINSSILFLNLGLVLAAAVLGFSAKSEDISDMRGEHPELAPLRTRLEELRRESYVLAGATRQSAGLAHAGISRVKHLSGSEPLRGWQSKVNRLESIIPLWRGENARLRTLDPANVIAFGQSAPLDIPDVDSVQACRIPAEFSRLQDEFRELQEKFATIAPHATPAVAHVEVRA